MKIDSNIKKIVAKAYKKASYIKIQHKYRLERQNITDYNIQQYIQAINQNEEKRKQDSLLIIRLSQIALTAKGYKQLITAEWLLLHQIKLEKNYIKPNQFSILSKAPWYNLKSISLRINLIADLGCKFLSRAEWYHLQFVYLQDNKIGNQGCSYLSKANWKKLKALNLSFNKIGDQGCLNLSKSCWKNLTDLHFTSGKRISDQGAKRILQGQYQKLQLRVSGNRISRYRALVFKQRLCTIDCYF